uniref:RxLR effector candidate protein n=1 Tax=Hyaloperonospora arabidopsidis (strain Emoy2) TaxID=559515 RepID=M4BU83_HYAAE
MVIFTNIINLYDNIQINKYQGLITCNRLTPLQLSQAKWIASTFFTALDPPRRFLTPCLLPTPQLSDPSTTEAKPTAVTATATYHDSHPTSNNTSLVFSIFVFYATTNHAHDNTSYSRQCFSRRQNAFLAALNSIVYEEGFNTRMGKSRTVFSIVNLLVIKHT